MNDIESGGILLDGFKTCLKCIYTENFFFFFAYNGERLEPQSGFTVYPGLHQ